MKKKYIIFDRDGTLIMHIHHLTDSTKVVFVDKLGECLVKLHLKGFRFGVISNQSVIAKKIGTMQEVDLINSTIESEVAKFNVFFDFFFYCPHQEKDDCLCRKPKIGLGEIAASKFDIDLQKSFMVGDQLSDAIFGKNMGLQTVVISSKSSVIGKCDFIALNLEVATEWIISQSDHR